MQLHFFMYGMFACSGLLLQSCVPFPLKALTSPAARSAPEKQIARAEIPQANHASEGIARGGQLQEEAPSLQLKESKILEENLPSPNQHPSPGEPSPPLSSATATLEATKVLQPTNRVETKATARQAISIRLLGQGKKLLANGNYRKALHTLEKALGFDSTDPQIHYHLAKAHYFLGQYSQAQNFLEIAESLSPGLNAETRTIANSVDVGKIKQTENR